jgi:hypothetical protein
MLLRLSIQDPFDPALAASLAHALHGDQAHLEIVGDLLVGQAFVRLEQDARALPLESLHALPLRHVHQHSALVLGQVHDVLLLHPRPLRTHLREGPRTSRFDGFEVLGGWCQTGHPRRAARSGMCHGAYRKRHDPVQERPVQFMERPAPR